MKKVLSCALSLALLGASLAVTASAHRLEYIDYSRDAVASRFEDVAGWEWFVPSLGHIGIGYGLIRGSADGEGNVRFYPQRSMTREQFVQGALPHRRGCDILRRQLDAERQGHVKLHRR